jgi:hypothetical protein
LTAPNVPRLARRTCSFDVLKSIVVPAQHHKLTGAQPMAVGELLIASSEGADRKVRRDSRRAIKFQFVVRVQHGQSVDAGLDCARRGRP